MGNSLIKDMKMLANVSFVMVTYGDRTKYILTSVRQILYSTDATVILVLNGVESGVYQCLCSNFEQHINSRLVLIQNACNEGSAGGFNIGLRNASTLEKEYSILLDDDNYLDSHALTQLNNLLNKPINSACACYRQDRRYMTDLINGVPAKDVFPKENSFMGFSFSRLFSKLFKSNQSIPFYKSDSTILPIKWAPYGGLIIKTKWLKSIGLPRNDYYLYADDTEFTYRIKKKYGLHLIPNLIVNDLEKSWNVATKRNLFSRLLLDGDDWKVFYSVRNQAHFDYHIYSGNRFRVVLNAFGFWLLISIMLINLSIKHKQVIKLVNRYALLIKACMFGVQGRLGKIDA